MQKIFSMSYSVKSIEVFERQARKLIKKYASLKSELLALVQELKENPGQGTAIGKSCYKIRLAIKSKGKGKSGGARVITNFLVSNDAVYPVWVKFRLSAITGCSLQLHPYYTLLSKPISNWKIPLNHQ